MKFNPTEYKKRNISIWNEVAPRYHKRWASINQGPFQSTSKLIQLLDINRGERVFDLACGTGVVTKKISQKVGNSGIVIGGDTSITAIKTAKKWIGSQLNLDFVNIDAENFNFSKQFDIITCQYALFFFPNAQKALKNIIPKELWLRLNRLFVKFGQQICIPINPKHGICPIENICPKDFTMEEERRSRNKKKK